MRYLLNLTKIAKELTFEELVILEEGKAKGTRAVLARYLADEEGKELGVEKGMEVLNGLKVWEVAKLAKEFNKAIREAAVNPLIEEEG